MGGFVQCSSRALATAAALLASACVERLPPIEGTTSLQITLISPTITGNIDDRLPDTARSITMTATALDAEGLVDTSFSGTLDVYAHYLGSLTPELGDEPLLSVPASAGRTGEFTVTLPQVYGPTFLWVEDASGSDPTFATGTSPLLYYRDPFLEDVSRPPDEAALDALERSPLEAKEVAVSGSRYGAGGRLIVTGVYAQGYTVSDVQCQDSAGSPPCVTGDYDHLFVFSFSRAEIEGGGVVQRAQFVDRVAGAVSEFNGLTELGFPQTFIGDRTTNESHLPPPIVIQPEWLASKIEMERAEAALVAIDNAVVCPLDDDFDTFSQWKLDLGGGCNSAVNIISKGEAAEFNPADHIGQTLPRVVGTLRPINTAGGNFNVWIIFPRDISDLTLP